MSKKTSKHVSAAQSWTDKEAIFEDIAESVVGAAASAIEEELRRILKSYGFKAPTFGSKLYVFHTKLQEDLWDSVEEKLRERYTWNEDTERLEEL